MNIQPLRPLALACLCLLLLAGCAVPEAAAPTPLPPTPTPVPPTPTAPPPSATPQPALATDDASTVLALMKAYQEAYNRQDADAVLAVFADQGAHYAEIGVVDLWGKDALRNYLAISFALDSVITEIKDCEVQDDGWHCTVLAHDACYPAYGLEGLGDSHSDTRVKLKDGKIQEFTIAVAPEEMKVYAAAFPKMMDWIKANRPDEYMILNNPGTAAQVFGETYLRMCKAYAAQLK
jgi:hypothetical protein